MNIWKNTVLFYLGGTAYMTLEFLWRGRSHGTMFLLGGLCFSMLGKIGRLRLNLPAKAALGTAGITALELLTGMLINRSYGIWDYRSLPLNYRGQICLPYTLLWLPLSIAAIFFYELADRALTFHTQGVK